MRQYLKEMFLAVTGGLLYIILELVWRGHSHWTMFVLGGLCFALIGLINELIPWCMPLWKQALIGAVIITGLELLTGCIVNLWLGMRIWDYSDMPGNLFGQVCPQYALLWVGMSVVAIVLDDVIRWRFFGEPKPKYSLF